MGMKREAVLLLGELGIGTKAEEPLMYDGLAHVLRERRGDTKFTGFVVDGGMIPRLPEYYGVTNAEDMHFLGTNPEKEDSERVKELKDRLGKIKVKHLRKKYGEFVKDREFLNEIDTLGQKITAKSEAAEVAKKNLKKVVSAMGIGVPLHYIEGEEDKKNQKELKELKIINYKSNKNTNEELDKKIGEREKRTGIIDDIVGTLGSLKSAKLKELDIEAGAIKEQLEVYQNGTGKLPENIEEIADKLGIDKSKVAELRSIDCEIEGMKDRIRDYEINDLAMLREKEASEFFRITKRRALTAQDEQVLERLAHYEYRETLRSIGQFEIHEEKEVRLKLGNLDLAIGHNLSPDSDTPNKNAMKKRILSYDSRKEQPDANAESHHGPLKVIVEKKEQFGDDVMLYMQIPTFQSEEKLKECLNEGIKNWHTKRLAKDMFGSGATIISKSDDGTIDIEFYDDRQLTEIGRKAAEVNELKKQLGKGGDEALKQKLAAAEMELKAAATYDYRQFIHDSDSHIGILNSIESPEEFRQRLREYSDLKAEYGRAKDDEVKKRLLEVTHQLIFGEVPSSLEIVRRAGRYIEDKVKIDGNTEYVLTGDEITGASFPGANTEYGVTIVRARDYLSAINESGLGPEEKAAFMEALLKRVVESTPVTKVSKQWQIYKSVKVPFLNAARRKGATLNVAGGNHLATSTLNRLYSEAVDLTNLLEESEGSHLKNIRYPEEGSDEAELYWEAGGGLFFAGHKPAGRGGDFAQRMMDHFALEPKGLRAVFFGHYHRPIIAYSKEAVCSMAPGKHTGESYCDMTGVGYGAHGINILWLDPKKPGHFKWRTVTDNPLKKYAELPIDPMKLAINQQ